jgi:anti-anti-sigma regulatory factor
MAEESKIFVVEQAGERTVVSFPDWQSSFGHLHGPEVETSVATIWDQLEDLVSQHQCKTLAIDTSSVGFLPSSFLAMLIGLFKNGVSIELLRPSPAVREILRSTKLDELFTVLD